MARLRAIAGDSPVNEGERIVVDALVSRLPDGYGVFPNFETSDRRRHRYEYDVVVTAPHAVYVIETKAYMGRVEGDDREWLVNDRVQPSPIRLTSHKARVLKGLLEDNVPALRDAWVEPAVALAFEPNRLHLTDAARAHTFLLDELIAFVQDPGRVSNRRSVTDLVARAENVLASVAQRRSGPKVFGDWRVLEVLEVDGEVAEYRARHQFASGAEPKRLRIVTLSPYMLSPADLGEQRKRVVREFTALTTMGPHPNVAAAEQAFEDGTNIVLVSTELDGITLGIALAEGLDASDEVRLGWLEGLVSALQHAHAGGVVHRRVSPENCVLTGNGELRLSGFGTAHIATEGTIHHDSANLDIDRRYVAPELLDGLGATTAAADAFGAACVAYALWAGEPPFDESWKARISTATKPAAMPAGVWAAIAPMLAADPADRPSHLEDLQAAVRAARAHQAAPPVEPAQVVPPLELRPGETFDDRYRIKEILGSGAFATVYRVVDDVAQEQVALKVLRPGYGLQTASKEFKALINIHHPNVVRVRHCERSHTSPVQWFVLMELAQGEALTPYTDGFKPRLPLAACLRVADQLLDALMSFHPDHERIATLKAKSELSAAELWELQRLQSEGLVHRDIKPQNILFEAATGQVKILDFNIASPAGASVLTVSGTPPYQPGDADLTAWRVDPDLFAVTVVLYELVTQRHPYEDRDPTKGDPIDPRSVIDVPDWLAELLLKGCASRKENRFGTAGEMRAALVLPENPAVPDPSDEFVAVLLARVESEGLAWDAEGLRDVVGRATLSHPLKGIVLSLSRDEDELRLSLDADDVETLRTLRRRQDAIELRAGIPLLPFESGASTWRDITSVAGAVDWVIDFGTRLESAAVEILSSAAGYGSELPEVPPGEPLGGAAPVLQLTTTRWRIPLLGVPGPSGTVVRQGRTIDGRAYPAARPTPVWLPDGSRLAFDHSVQGEWTALGPDGSANYQMVGEQQSDGSWLVASPPGSVTAFGTGTLTAKVLDVDGAAAVGITFERTADAASRTSDEVVGSSSTRALASTTASTGPPAEPDLIVTRVQKVVEAARAAAGGDRLATRLAAESEVKRLLDARGGALTADELSLLLRTVKTDLASGRVAYTRFPGSFLHGDSDRLVGQFERINMWLRQLWGDERDARAAADEMLRLDTHLAPGIGPEFPSVLMYLRDPKTWAPASAFLKRGANELGVGMRWDRADGVDGLSAWSAEVRDFCSRYGVSVHEVDAVFAAAVPKASKRPPTPAPASAPRSLRKRTPAEARLLLAKIRGEIDAGRLERARSLTPPEWMDVLDEIGRAAKSPASERRAELPSADPVEIQFHKDMLTLGKRAAKETGYRPSRFLQMVANDGGYATAKVLLRSPTESEGFRELWERGRLDLSAETLVLLPKYQSLFSDGERRTARKRLEAYGERFD